jgi:hypothetical protein
MTCWCDRVPQLSLVPLHKSPFLLLLRHRSPPLGFCAAGCIPVFELFDGQINIVLVFVGNFASLFLFHPLLALALLTCLSRPLLFPSLHPFIPFSFPSAPPWSSKSLPQCHPPSREQGFLPCGAAPAVHAAPPTRIFARLPRLPVQGKGHSKTNRCINLLHVLILSNLF